MVDNCLTLEEDHCSARVHPRKKREMRC